MSESVKTLIANLAAEHRRRDRDSGRIRELRQQIKDRQTEEFIRKALATAPPLSQAARDELAVLLASGK